MDDIDQYEGQASRTCQECQLTITVIHPTRVLSRTSNKAWRKKARQEIARQILWEACCPVCRAYWNTILRRVETVPEDDGLEDEAAA